MAFEGSRIKWARQQSYIKWLMRFWPFYSCLNKIRLWNGYSCEEFWYSPPCWTVLDTSALKWYTELGEGAEYIYKLQGLKEDNSKDRHRWGWHAYEINQQNGVTTALNLNTLSRWTSSVILSAPQCWYYYGTECKRSQDSIWRVGVRVSQSRFCLQPKPFRVYQVSCAFLSYGASNMDNLCLKN